MRIIGRTLLVLAIALGLSGAANAQTNISAAPTASAPQEGTYRGGNNLMGHGCDLGADACQVGILLQFFKNSQGQMSVSVFTEAGSATYAALVNGAPYANEGKMRNQGTFPVVFAKDGTFGFSYREFIYDRGSVTPAGKIQLFFHKTQGSSQNWVTLTPG